MTKGGYGLLELIKEEHIGEIQVVMRKDEKMEYIEVRAYNITGRGVDSGQGFAQFIPLGKNEEVDGPASAEEYFQALVAWFKGGRKGHMLPFEYSDGS